MILETPVIEFSQNTIQYIQGDSLRLECPVSRWLPQPTNIQWFKDSQALPPSQDSRLVTIGWLLFVRGSVKPSDQRSTCIQIPGMAGHRPALPGSARPFTDLLVSPWMAHFMLNDLIDKYPPL